MFPEYNFFDKTSPCKIAMEYGEFLIDKISRIASSFSISSIITKIVFKALVPREEKEFIFKQVKIEKVYKTINKIKLTNSRGNDEINIKLP